MDGHYLTAPVCHLPFGAPFPGHELSTIYTYFVHVYVYHLYYSYYYTKNCGVKRMNASRDVPKTIGPKNHTANKANKSIHDKINIIYIYT
jgi:hypothetical protein